MYSAHHTSDNWFVLRITAGVNNPRYVTALCFNPDLRANKSRVPGRRLTVTVDVDERRLVQGKALLGHDRGQLVRLLNLILNLVGGAKLCHPA